MTESTTILDGYSDQEKGAYLGAIASIATADQSAGQQEIAFLGALCETASLSREQTAIIGRVASTPVDDDTLRSFLDVLKTSELRFSLVSDLIAFSQSDSHYSEAEKKTVGAISQYLGLNEQQFSVLDEFTKRAVEEAPKHAADIESDKTTPSNFLENLGLGNKMSSAGINKNSLLKGALGVIGPMLLAKMLRGKGRQSGTGVGVGVPTGESTGAGVGLGGAQGGTGGGGIGGALGSIFGGGSGGGGGIGGALSSILGGGSGKSGGLLGSILGGGRGFGNAGNLLGRILGGKR